MKDKPVRSGQLQLRIDAERELAQRKPASAATRTTEEIQHELQVHQIELEMQNEALRQAQIAIEESRDRYVNLYDFAPVGYLTLTSDALIGEINLTGAALIREDRRKLVNHRFNPYVAAEDRDRWHRYFLEVLKHDTPSSCTIELQRGDGTRFLAEVDGICIKDESGKKTLRIVLADITERQLTLDALHESELLFRTMLNHAPIIIWMSDVTWGNNYPGSIFYNRRWHDFTGHASDETRVDNWISYVHPDDRERCLAQYQDAFKEERTFRMEYRLRRKDGEYRMLEDSAVPRYSESGKFLGHIGTCVDITEHMQFEELRTHIERVGRLNIAGEMASGLAHELSQPLTACSNYLEACLRRMDGENWDRQILKDSLLLASKQAIRAGKIINHLKDLARKQNHEHAPLDLNGLVGEVLSFLEDEIRHHGITVRMNLSDIPQVMASRVEIEQVLLNLCQNAMEAMRSSQQRELFISTDKIDSGQILVTVKDSGIGAVPDDTESMFDAFNTSKKDGLGLGLSICRSFVENHGGRIWAETQPKQGVVFYFTLPVK